MPFKKGCYSLVANRDMEVLVEQKWLNYRRGKLSLGQAINPSWILDNWVSDNLKSWYAETSLRGNELVAYVYKSYPYFATRSELLDTLISEGYLTKSNVTEIHKSEYKPKSTGTVIFTLGYEGRTIEEYINKLTDNGIELVCDVRRNPLSRKYGFSKSVFSSILNDMHIGYEHIGKLGIVSEDRSSLDSPSDYKKLFKRYAKNIPNNQESIERITKLASQYKRIAITCFEELPEFCHRHCITDYMATQPKLAKAVRFEHL